MLEATSYRISVAGVTVRVSLCIHPVELISKSLPGEAMGIVKWDLPLSLTYYLLFQY